MNLLDKCEAKEGFIYGYAPQISNELVLKLAQEYPDRPMLHILDKVMQFQPKYANASKYDRQMALRRGELPCVEFKKICGGSNRITDLLISDILSFLTTSVTHLALGTRGAPQPAAGDVILGNEIIRFTSTDVYNNGAYTFVFSCELGPAVGIISTGNTNVSTIGATVNTFRVTDGTAISVNDRIRVQTSVTGDFTFVTVVTKTLVSGVSYIFTVTPNLPAPPIVGDTVTRVYGEGGLFRYGSPSLNSGRLANHKLMDLYKTTELVILDGVLVFQPVTQ